METPRLPHAGEQAWDNVLNDFLRVAHNEDGTLKAEALTTGTELVTSVAGKTGDVSLGMDDIQDLATTLATTERLSNKGRPNGYPNLDPGGKVPMTQLQPYPMPKQSVQVCLTTPITLASPGVTLDGQALKKGDRLLLTAQARGLENGIYAYNGPTVPLTRTPDANTGPLVQNAFVFVNLGSQAQSGWVNVTPGPIGINATPLTWRQFEAPILSQPNGQLSDANGAAVLLAQGAADAVNQLSVTSAASGSAPMISTTGPEASVPLQIDPQGGGAVLLHGPVVITNPTTANDLVVQSSSPTSDSVMKVQGGANRAAFLMVNSQNAAYGYVAGQVSGATKWMLGRNGSSNGVTLYTAGKAALQVDDNQALRLSSGLAYHRTAVTAASYSAISSDHLIAYTGPAQAVTITLPDPATVAGGQFAAVIVVKDEVGVATANPITVRALSTDGIIDGALRRITTDYGSLQLYADGSKWHVLGLNG